MKVYSLRLPDEMYEATLEYGRTKLGTDNFSEIVRHILGQHLATMKLIDR